MIKGKTAKRQQRGSQSRKLTATKITTINSEHLLTTQTPLFHRFHAPFGMHEAGFGNLFLHFFHPYGKNF
ncbi:MAG: hypothetical protein D8B56_06460 [Alloprevotella sp.]|nr:MAG: hypothetical protein D8B56_06460 [Alloprevotella sp.]